jgi:DNA polymerase-3 subunit alpha
VAYQTAYLKANYPREYMAALLTSVMGSTDKVAEYVVECRRLGVPVLPPDVNESQADFTVVEGGIRFGLAAVKNVGQGAIESIVAARRAEGPFRSLADFARRVDLRLCNRRALESLVKAGAFDSLGARRAQLMAALDDVLKRVQQSQRRGGQGQVSLFGGEPDEAVPVPLPAVEEYPRRQLLAMEKEVLGLYLSGHPLESVADRLQAAALPIAQLGERSDGDRVTVGGIVAAVRRTATRRKEPMAFVTLEDLASQVDVVVFPAIYERYREMIAPDALLLVTGKVSWKDEQVTLVADDLRPLLGEEAAASVDPAVGVAVGEGRMPAGGGAVHPRRPAAGGTAGARDGRPRSAAAPTGEAVWLSVPPDGSRQDLELLRAAIRANPGTVPVYLRFASPAATLRLGREFGVTPGEPLRRAVEEVLGPGRYLHGTPA